MPPRRKLSQTKLAQTRKMHIARRRLSGEGSRMSSAARQSTSAMPIDDLDFNAEEFVRMSHDERVAICRQLAARARELAELGDVKHRESYLKIASEWDKLVDEMKRQT